MQVSSKGKEIAAKNIVNYHAESRANIVDIFEIDNDTKCGDLYEDVDFMELYRVHGFSKSIKIYLKYWRQYKSRYPDEESVHKAEHNMVYGNQKFIMGAVSDMRIKLDDIRGVLGNESICQ